MFTLPEGYPIPEKPHDVLRYDAAEEVKAYRDDLALRRKQHNQTQGQPEQPAYAFTEILFVNLRSSNTDLKSMATEEGKAFAQYLKTILETAQGLSRLLWGTRHGAAERVVVLLDWERFESRQRMQQDASYNAATDDLQVHLTEPISSRAFDFRNAVDRSDCFGRHFSDSNPNNSDTTFYIWDFQTPSRGVEFVLPQQDTSSDTLLEGTDARYYEIVEGSIDKDGQYTASSKEEDTVQDSKQYKRTFDLHWEHFALQYYRYAAYRHEGSRYGPCQFIVGHRPSWGGGWEVPLSPDGGHRGDSAYCGVIGTWDFDSISYLDQLQGKSYEEGGLAPLQSIATGGVNIFHVKLHRLTSWQGSVISPSPLPMSVEEYQSKTPAWFVGLLSEEERGKTYMFNPKK